jgi:hypothetical protein
MLHSRGDPGRLTIAVRLWSLERDLSHDPLLLQAYGSPAWVRTQPTWRPSRALGTLMLGVGLLGVSLAVTPVGGGARQACTAGGQKPAGSLSHAYDRPCLSPR